MVNASELLRKNARKIEAINSKTTNQPQTYDRPWRENLDKSTQGIEQDFVANEVKEENRKEPKTLLKASKSLKSSHPSDKKTMDNSLEAKSEKLEGSFSSPTYTSSKLALYKYLLDGLGSSDRAFQYLMLMEICDTNHEIQLSQAQISSDLKLNVLTVRRMLSDLLSQGFVEKTREYDAKTKDSAAFKLLKGFDPSEFACS